MGMGEGDLGGGVPLGSADIGEGFVLRPGELGGDGAGGAGADAGHGGEKFFQAGGIGVEGFKHRSFAVAEFVLRLAGAQGFGEVAPEGIEALVGHFENAADVGGLAAIEEEIGGRGIGVFAVLALQKAEGEKGVEEIASGAGMEAEATAEVFEGFGALREFGEEAHFDGTEEHFGRPEAEPNLENVLGGRTITHENLPAIFVRNFAKRTRARDPHQ